MGPTFIFMTASAKTVKRWRWVEEENMVLVPPYDDDPRIIAGAGTAALELMTEVSHLDAVITPVGGGGLISGTALAVKGHAPETLVAGVEPARGNDVYLSIQAGKRVTILAPETVADGLRTTSPGKLTFPIIQRLVDHLFLVTEEEIRDAWEFAFTRLKLVIEPSSAVALAALLHHQVPADIKRVGVIISGGNVDLTMLTSLRANPPI
jgi:threo-3-hydroxy-L-aspartate ammonia-lyase